MSIIVFSWEELLPLYHMRREGEKTDCFSFRFSHYFLLTLVFGLHVAPGNCCDIFYSTEICACVCVSKFIQTHCILDDLPNGHQFTWPLWRPKPRNGKAICRNKMSSNSTIDGMVNGWKWDKTINPNSQRKWKKWARKWNKKFCWL